MSDLSNIAQGNDANKKLSHSNDNITPSVTDFSEPDHMDNRNLGDHDATGRFNPFGGLPPTNPNFGRQLAPILGGKHVDDNDDGSPSIVDPSVVRPPTLGEKRQDEPDQDRVGLDPSRGKMKID